MRKFLLCIPLVLMIVFELIVGINLFQDPVSFTENMIVVFGVFMIVRCSIVWDGFHMLLQEGEFTPARKVENRKNELLETVYWCSVIAIYLAYSFITGRWDRSWIVWPVAGVFSGAVKGGAGIVRKRG